MKFVIYPLSYKKEDKKKAIKDSNDLAKRMDHYNDNEETVRFIMAGIIVFCDKVIDEETRKNVKEWLKMTGIARLFEEEKTIAVKEAAEEKAETGYRNCISRGMSEEEKA